MKKKSNFCAWSNELARFVKGKKTLKFSFIFLMSCVIQLSTIDVKAQDKEKITIAGNVVDTQNEPLPGVALYFKGTTIGTITNMDGDFMLELTSDIEDPILEVSMLGFKKISLPIGEKREFQIVLKEDMESLEEVVVTGIQTIKKGRATGSFTILTSDDLNKVVSQDISQKLEGASPGLLIDGDKILIRGAGTLKAGTEPLYVVDGVAMDEKSIKNLNPSDIEQISVLKDAAAASVWGIRAANGVIVITTKRAKSNQGTIVNYSGTFSIQDNQYKYNDNYLGSDQLAKRQWEYFVKQDQSIGQVGRYYKNDVAKVYHDYRNKTISEEVALKKINEIGQYDNRDFIEDEFYRKAILQQHNVSVSTSKDKLKQYFSLSFDSNRSRLVGNDNWRTNVVSNTDYTITPGINIGVNLRLKYGEGKYNEQADAAQLLQYQRILDSNGDYIPTPQIYDQTYLNETSKITGVDWTHNLLRKQRMNDKTNNDLGVNAGMFMNIQLFEGLKYSFRINLDVDKTTNEEIYGSDHYNVRNLRNQFTHIENGNILQKNFPYKGGLLYATGIRRNTVTLRNVLSYTKEYNDWNYNVLAGQEIYESNRRKIKSEIIGYNDQSLTSGYFDYYRNKNGEMRGFENDVVDYSPHYGVEEYIEKYASYFGTARVSYKRKYDLFSSVRLDQTNLIVKASKYRNNPSWSVGFKWNLAKEFFTDQEILNNLAFRLSHGVSGNMSKNVGPNLTTSIEQSFWLPGYDAIKVVNPENPKLGWEKAHTTNIGLDFAFFNYRLNGNIEYYNKRTKDVLSQVTSDPTTGWSELLLNSAEILNQGIDLTLNSRIIDREITFDLGLIYSYNKNEVTDISFIPTALGMRAYQEAMKGQPINYVAYVKYANLDEKGNPQIMKKGDNKVYNYQEFDNLETEDFHFDGTFTPSHYGSLTPAIGYKKLRLSAFISYKLGHKFRMAYNETNGFSSHMDKWSGDDYVWKKAGDEKTKVYPGLPAANDMVTTRQNAFAYSSYLIDNADVIRLRSLSLSYDISSLLSAIKLKSGLIKFSVENLAVWHNNKFDVDPEFYEISGKAPKRYMVALNVKF